jgi:hypothetical protein
MLTAFDDYLIHQTIDTLDHVATGDPRFQDRGLFNVYRDNSEFLLQVGFGIYPNQNMIDAWICGVHRDKQYNLRVARPLRHDRTDLHIGPLHIDIVRPMAEWRLRIDESDYGLACDLTFRARAEAYEFLPVFVRRNNHVDHHQMHLMQTGVYEGTVRVGDFEAQGAFIGSRDRSWGVRGPQVNQQIDMKNHAAISTEETPEQREAAPASQARRAWIDAEFETYALHAWFWTDVDGEPLIADGVFVDVASGKTSARLASWDEPVIVTAAEGYVEKVELTLRDKAGQSHVLLVTPLVSRSPHGNGYFEGFHGRPRTSLHTEGESWDMSDPQFRAEHGYMNGPMLARFEHARHVGYGVIITSMFARSV